MGERKDLLRNPDNSGESDMSDGSRHSGGLRGSQASENRLGDLFGQGFLDRLERLRLIVKHAGFSHMSGQSPSRGLGDGLEFADHRDYNPGDDMRFVDWPYYARMDKLLLRTFHKHSEADLLIGIDCSGSMCPQGDEGKFAATLRTAAALAYVAMGSLTRVTLLPFGEQIESRGIQPYRTGRNRHEIMQVLDYLRSLPHGGRGDLARWSGEMAAGMGAASMVLISDLLDIPGDMADGLKRLRSVAGSVLVLHLYSLRDCAGEIGTHAVLLDSERDCSIELAVTNTLRAQYVSCWKEFQAACRKACVSSGVSYVNGRADDDFDRHVLAALTRTGVLRS